MRVIDWYPCCKRRVARECYVLSVKWIRKKSDSYELLLKERGDILVQMRS